MRATAAWSRADTSASGAPLFLLCSASVCGSLLTAVGCFLSVPDGHTVQQHDLRAWPRSASPILPHFNRQNMYQPYIHALPSRCCVDTTTLFPGCSRLSMSLRMRQIQHLLHTYIVTIHWVQERSPMLGRTVTPTYRTSIVGTRTLVSWSSIRMTLSRIYCA
jgi:hypothetical protein